MDFWKHYCFFETLLSMITYCYWLNDNKRVLCWKLFNSFLFSSINSQKRQRAFIATESRQRLSFNDYSEIMTQIHICRRCIYIFIQFFLRLCLQLCKKKKKLYWREIIKIGNNIVSLMHLISAYFNEYIISAYIWVIDPVNWNSRGKIFVLKQKFNTLD